LGKDGGGVKDHYPWYRQLYDDIKRGFWWLVFAGVVTFICLALGA
jgi:hypothetical protein